MNSQTTNLYQLTATAVKDAFHSSARGRRCRAMLGDRSADRMLRHVYAWCSRNLPALDPARKHLSRELCGSVTWSVLKPKEYICAGMCIAFLATHGVLPLRMHKTRSGKGPKAYWITKASTRPAKRTSSPASTHQGD